MNITTVNGEFTMIGSGSLLWIFVIGALVFFLMRQGGGCCGGGHSHDHDHETDREQT